MILDERVSANAVRVYAVLKSLVSGKPPKGTIQAARVTHAEISGRLPMSHKTLVGALNQLENVGWIVKETNSGAANLYIFTDLIFD